MVDQAAADQQQTEGGEKAQPAEARTAPGKAWDKDRGRAVQPICNKEYLNLELAKKMEACGWPHSRLRCNLRRISQADHVLRRLCRIRPPAANRAIIPIGVPANPGNGAGEPKNVFVRRSSKATVVGGAE